MSCIEAWLADLRRDSLTVELATGEKFVFPFDKYGYFRHCPISELEHVVCDGFSLEWPEAQIDFELELLRHPEMEGDLIPVDKWLAYREKQRQREALAAVTARAGSTRSARKSAAARRNGARGGRPRKRDTDPLVTA